MNEENKKRILIIVGAAPSALADVNTFLALRVENGAPKDDGVDFMIIGMDAAFIPTPVKYMATYHPVDIDEARKRREAAGLNTDFAVIAHQQNQDKVSLIIPCKPPSGSSALLGVLAGIKYGYKKIIVCGCPLQDKKYLQYQKGWTAKKEEIKNVTRSMSGWTRELLGAPDAEWLSEK
jgi:hypothetical protein